jgi:hypothetical protein
MHINRMKETGFLLVVLAVGFTVACGRPSEPRVFFVQPQDSATVKSPVHFEFGAEQFTISPVPEGTVETPRPDVGHYHLGVDVDCMPSAQVIPPGTQPWVHFGKGNNTIDMQLTPGQHRFALQVGDDQHRTIEGLCQTISVTVGE